MNLSGTNCAASGIFKIWFASKGKKKAIYQVLVPLPLPWDQKVIHRNNIFSIVGWGPNIMSWLVREPTILPNSGGFLIPNSPISFFLQNPWCLLDTPLVVVRRVPVSASRNEHLGKYFALSILATVESSYLQILHPCFASKALLKSPKLLKPMPPFSLDLHKVDNFDHWILLFSFLYYPTRSYLS